MEGAFLPGWRSKQTRLKAPKIPKISCCKTLEISRLWPNGGSGGNCWVYPDIISWRDSLAKTKVKEGYAIRSVKRKLSSISKFFEFLCDENFVKINPVLGVERPKLKANEGVTQAISTQQAKDLLETPDPKTLKGKRVPRLDVRFRTPNQFVLSNFRGLRIRIPNFHLRTDYFSDFSQYLRDIYYSVLI